MKNFWKKYKYLLISCASVAAVLLVWYLLIDVMKLTKNSVFPGVEKTFGRGDAGAAFTGKLESMPSWLQHRRGARDPFGGCHGME